MDGINRVSGALRLEVVASHEKFKGDHFFIFLQVGSKKIMEKRIGPEKN